MPNLVQNFHDARRKIAAASEAIARAQQAIEEANQALTWMEDVLGPLPESAKTKRPASIPANPDDTWASRVLQIIKESGPLKASRVRDIYKNQKLKDYEKEDLYMSILNALVYLKEKGRVIKTEQGYLVDHLAERI